MFISAKYRDLLHLTAIIMLFGILASLLFSLKGSVCAAETMGEVSASRVLIIDPGHGGLDGGAVGFDGSIESRINLDIALKMRDLSKLFGIETVMTRETDSISYPDENASIAQKKNSDQKMRIELIRAFPNGCVISIHQNTYPSPAIHGAQVFYRDTPRSKALAEHIQANFNSKLISTGRRVASPISRDILLMKSIDCTAVLVECGFLTNPDECVKLSSGDYQTKLAMTVFGAWMAEN